MGGGHFRGNNKCKGLRQDRARCVGKTARRPLRLELSERGRGGAEARRRAEAVVVEEMGLGGPTGLWRQCRRGERAAQAEGALEEEQVRVDLREGEARARRHTAAHCTAFPHHPEIRGPQNSVETFLQAKEL